MRTFFLAIGDRTRASSRLRIWDHQRWFSEHGDDVHADYVVPSGVAGWRLGLRLLLRYPVWMWHFFRADRIVLQETVALAPLLPFRSVGGRRRIVYDFSDPIDLHGSGVRGLMQRAGFRLSTRWAHRVVFENGSYGADLQRRGVSARQFCGPVDCERYAQGRRQRPITDSRSVRLGWTGSPSTLPLLRPLFPALRQIVGEGRATLVLLGVRTAPPELAGVPVTAIEWEEASEFSIVPSFDLGLFALDESEHSRRRGAGKLFIYLAAGVPFIATNAGIAHELMQATGLGFSVDGANWEPALRAAIDAVDRRRELSRRGLDVARERFSYDRYRDALWADLASPLRP